MTVHEVPCVIGRSPACSLHLSSPEVSRRHAVVLRDGNHWWVADCGSRGGTWLNGTRVMSAARLEHGDRIGVGMMSMTFLSGAWAGAAGSAGASWLETTLPGDSDWVITSGTAVVWVDPDGRIPQASPAAMAWLAIFFDGTRGQLPERLGDWLAAGGDSPPHYERKIGGERLRIDACGGRRLDGGHLLLLRRLAPAFDPASLRKFGFTRAESLVVPWLVRGKRNEEIACILGVSARTVEKQVAAVLEKLHVETRTAAAWTLIERTGAHG